MYCTCERVQTVTKATKESSILQWPAIVMVPEVTCQAKSVLPLHTASKPPFKEKLVQRIY